MVPILSQYGSPPPIRSALIKNPPDAVPPTDDLKTLHEELKMLKHKTLERAKKAGEDLRTIEESMKRMKEREKGKGKAVDKASTEHEYTPGADDEGRGTNSTLASSSKPRFGSIPVSSVPTTPSRSSSDPRRLLADDPKKKKKRKREDDSDLEHESQRLRKASPVPQHTHPHPAPKSVKHPLVSHSKPPPGPDFTIPIPQSLLQTRPPIPPPPVPGPSKPTDVHEDFSKAKVPQQVLINTFYSSIEPWIRPIKEEDVGFLEWTADEVEPYMVPNLGKHYLDVWEEEDMRMPGGVSPRLSSGQTAAPLPGWDPSTLMEPDLLTEERGHGPLTERLISALLPNPDLTVWKGVKAAEDAMEGRPGGSGAAAARREKINVGDLEERIRDTMRFHGLLDGVPDYAEKVDDPIASALRHTQQELRTVIATNKARKKRLIAIARDRLGYQEYLDVRDSIDKNIVSLYTKLQKKDLPKVSKKKKKPEGAAPVNGKEGNGVVVPLPNPAALGLGPDETNTLVVNDALKRLVDTRRQWASVVGEVFEEKERDNPGRIWGIPRKSVYEGLEEDVQRELEQPIAEIKVSDPSKRTTKGKERATGDMGVGG